MSGYRIQRAAGERLDEIYVYTLEQWGEAQADHYIRGMFARFEAIAAHAFPWRQSRRNMGSAALFAATNVISSTGKCWTTARLGS